MFKIYKYNQYIFYKRLHKYWRKRNPIGEEYFSSEYDFEGVPIKIKNKIMKLIL